ncbi:hypothetical protein SLEP1_g58522 [Rubroshorea leprosula]|uniref:CG-1 domain-containing protein n=1 Tax=Rubroshorea leprosula TaxID=152421 RepID=A0AAV5MQK7_9ROSI|nr:hypothetical protein SLEP1_g58522 [Rubroshorea leprosula]
MDESVEAGPSVLDNPLDIEQIYSKAQNQWFSKPELCQILQNHKGFHITSAPHEKPPSTIPPIIIAIISIIHFVR